jgi:predicted Rossmann fold flavoprotein
MEYDVLVIGAGAAGLMTAIVAGGRGKRVLVVDHANRAGKKILMSGGGRCNFTNTATTPTNFLSDNPHFCKSALARYTPWDFIAMVDKHQIAWHEKSPGQLFCDDSSKQIVAMLMAECATAGVRVEINCGVTRLRAAASGFACETPLGHVRAASVVVATGGLSIPSLGASGFGYEVAKQFGHTVLPLRAGLVPLTLSGKHLERFDGLSGVALPVEARANGESFRDAMLITHRGISGPSILQISSYWEPGVDLRVDLLPGVDAVEALREGRAERPAAELKTVLSSLLPRRLAERLCEIWLPNRPMRQYRDAELSEIGAQLSDWPIVASGTEGYRTAEVTLGGVDTDGVSSSTMMSKVQPGLYFVGEVLDVTGHLGGYNFQWAWASGNAAGLAV